MTTTIRQTEITDQNIEIALRADLDYRVNLKNELLLSEVLRRLENIETHRVSQPNKERKFRPSD